MTRFELLFPAAALAVTPAFAAEPVSQDVVITASRLPTPSPAMPYAVKILPEAQVIGRASVADALSDAPEVYVQAPGGRSGVAALFLRGSDPNFTSVLFDGVPLNNSANVFGGAVNVSEISAAGIERIELVTGPLSSLYGSGALAGLVNLVLPAGSPQHQVNARAGFGTAEDHQAFLRWRGPVASGYGGSIAAIRDHGGKDPGGARFKSNAVIGKFAPLGRAEAGRIVFRLTTSESRSFPDSSGGPDLAVIRDLEEREGREALIGANQPILEKNGIRVDLSGSYLHRRDRTSNPGVAPSALDPVGIPAGEDETRYSRAMAQASLRYEGAGWQAVAGAETQREVARSEGELNFFGMTMPTGFRGDRWTHSAFAEASRTTAEWTLNAGARIDAIDGFRAQVTGRIGLRYAISDTGLSFRAAAGTGFKAPSFYALGNPFVGNPALDPERSRSFEAGLDYRAPGGASISLTAFRTRFGGLIDFVPDPFPQLQNRNVVISRGISGSASVPLGERLEVLLQAQYAETRDRDTGERLLNRPDWRSSSLLSWRPTETLAFVARHRFVGRRRAFSVPTGVTGLSGYHHLSVEGAWAVAESTSLRLVVDNAGDESYEDAVGFPSPGRRARILIGHSF